jgi:hypothetical protein
MQLWGTLLRNKSNQDKVQRSSVKVSEQLHDGYKGGKVTIKVALIKTGNYCGLLLCATIADAPIFSKILDIEFGQFVQG